MRGRSSDGALVARARGGDERAFEAIYERDAPRLYSFCRRFLSSASDAEDALQATFVTAWRGLGNPEGEPPRSLQSWLFRIAHDKAVSVLRERERRPVPREEPAGDAVGEELAVASERRIELREVLSDIAALGERQRAVLLLLELGGLGQAQVGEIVGEPVDRVREIARSARRSLSGAREARNADCAEIQRELSTIRRGRLRAPVHLHIRRCEPCRRYRAAVREQRKVLGIALPVALPAGLKAGCLPSVAEAAEGSGAVAGEILTRLRQLGPDRLAGAQGAAAAGAAGAIAVAAGAIAVASLGGGGGAGPKSPAIPVVDGSGDGGGASAAARTGARDGGGPASRRGASRGGASGGADAGGAGAGATTAGGDSGVGVAEPAIASGDPEPGTAPGDPEPQAPAVDPEPPPPPDPPRTPGDDPPRDPSDGAEINSELYTGVGEPPAGPPPPLDPPPSAPTDPPEAPPTSPPEPDPVPPESDAAPPEPVPQPPGPPPDECRGILLPPLGLCIELPPGLELRPVADRS